MLEKVKEETGTAKVKGQPRKFKVVNIGDAINKKDLVRIRSGSPGLRAGQKPKDLSAGQTF